MYFSNYLFLKNRCYFYLTLSAYLFLCKTLKVIAKGRWLIAEDIIT